MIIVAFAAPLGAGLGVSGAGICSDLDSTMGVTGAVLWSVCLGVAGSGPGDAVDTGVRCLLLLVLDYHDVVEEADLVAFIQERPIAGGSAIDGERQIAGAAFYLVTRRCLGYEKEVALDAAGFELEIDGAA